MLEIDGKKLPKGGSQYKGTATVLPMEALEQENVQNNPDAMVAQAKNIKAQQNDKKNQIQIFRLPENVSGMKSIALILSGIGIASILSWFSNFRQPESQPVVAAQPTPPQIIYIQPPIATQVMPTPALAASQETATTAHNLANAASAVSPVENGNVAAIAASSINAGAGQPNVAVSGSKTQPQATNHAPRVQQQQHGQQVGVANGAAANTKTVPRATAQQNGGNNLPVTKHSPNLRSIGVIDPRADAMRLKQQAAAQTPTPNRVVSQNNRVNNASAFPQQGGVMINNAYAIQPAPIQVQPNIQTAKPRQSSGGEEISFNKAYLEKNKERNATPAQDVAARTTEKEQHPTWTLSDQQNQNTNEENLPIAKCSPFKTKSECR